MGSCTVPIKFLNCPWEPNAVYKVYLPSFFCNDFIGLSCLFSLSCNMCQGAQGHRTLCGMKWQLIDRVFKPHVLFWLASALAVAARVQTPLPGAVWVVEKFRPASPVTWSDVEFKFFHVSSMRMPPRLDLWWLNYSFAQKWIRHMVLLKWLPLADVSVPPDRFGNDRLWDVPVIPERWGLTGKRFKAFGDFISCRATAWKASSLTLET